MVKLVDTPAFDAGFMLVQVQPRPPVNNQFRKLTRADLMLRISSSTTSQGFQIRSSCSLCCVYDVYNDPLHRLFAAHAASMRMSVRHIILPFHVGDWFSSVWGYRGIGPWLVV